MAHEKFPVLWPYPRATVRLLEQLGCPRTVPWSLVAPHEKRAFSNHGQTLRRLAQRGGLSPYELVRLLRDESLRFCRAGDNPDVHAVPELLALIRKLDRGEDPT